MKKIQTCLMLLWLCATMDIIHASATMTAIASSAGETIIINKSNMPIQVAYSLTQSKDGYWSADVAPGASTKIAYKAGDVITQVAIFYDATGLAHPSAANKLAIDGAISFCISKIDGCSLYIYGNKAFAPGVADTTNAASPVPARYVAWWTGTVPASDATAVAAIADPNVSKMVIMHVANPSGLNDTANPTVPQPF